MPSLILFGKRTFLSGDDLRIVAAIAIGYRFLQLGLTSAIVGYILQLLSNGDGWGVRVEWILEKLCIHNGGVRNAALYLPELAYTYAAVSMITSIYGLYFAVRLFRLAGKGTPTDDKERRVPLQRHIQWNLTIGNFLRACSFIFGILTINNMDDWCDCLTPSLPADFEGEHPCPDHYNIWMTFLGILIVTHAIDISYAILSLVYIQSDAVSGWSGRSSSLLVPKRDNNDDDKRKCVPTKCLSKLQSTVTCCIVGGIEGFVPSGKLAEISLVIFHYFQAQNNILDLTPSDIFAALVMVERLHRQERAEQQQLLKLSMSSTQQNPSVEPKVIMNASSSDAEENGIDQMVVVEGAWFLDMAQSMYTWSLTQNIAGSLWSKCTIIYSQLRTDVPKTPYVIAVDHESESIVVVICRTQSLEELLSEIYVEPKELERVGEICGFDGKHKYCHATMLASAEWIYQDVKEQGILHKLIQEDDSSSTYPNYQLRVTGQCVGAGIASVLSLLLRSSFPKVRCLAFSSPGCVFSSNVDCSEWVVSYVLDSDSDILPRLSADSFDAFRKELLETFCRIQVPKYRVLRRNRYHVLGDQSLADLKLSNDIMMCAKEDILDTEFQAQVEEYQNTQDRARSKGSSVKLILPGKIVQLSTSKDTQDLSSFQTSSSRRYLARWVELKDLSRINITEEFL